MAERYISYERLKWPQLREAVRDDKVIPFASIEMHAWEITAPPGHHDPDVDQLERQDRAASS